MNQIEEILYNSTGEVDYKIIYKYDNNMNQIEEIKYNSFGQLENQFKRFYNSKNKVIESQSFNSSRNLIFKSLYKYNNNSYTVKYYEGNNLNYKSYSKFDNEGNEVEKSESNCKRTFKYNKNRDIIEEKVYYNDKLDEHIIKNYDKYNNLILEKTIYYHADVYEDFEVIVNQKEFKYDKHGNWVLEIDFKNLRITERTIEYY